MSKCCAAPLDTCCPGVYQADQLASVHCATAEVRHSYKHRHLKTAFAHLPQSKEATTAMGTKARPWQP